MKQNVSALLKGRRLTQKDLAEWCLRSETWASKILDINSPRVFPLKYWDKIADFFGIATYQLLQPGISALTERRKVQRRIQPERRVSRLLDSAGAGPGFTDTALVREVLSVPYDERPLLFASIAELKRKRLDVPPNREPPAGAAPSGVGPTRLRPRGRLHPRKPRNVGDGA